MHEFELVESVSQEISMLSTFFSAGAAPTVALDVFASGLGGEDARADADGVELGVVGVRLIDAASFSDALRRRPRGLFFVAEAPNIATRSSTELRRLGCCSLRASLPAAFLLTGDLECRFAGDLVRRLPCFLPRRMRGFFLFCSASRFCVRKSNNFHFAQRMCVV